MIGDRTLSRYLDDLPAIYRQEAPDGHPDFLGRFLLAFEHVLTGVGRRCRPGLEEILDGIVVGPDAVLLAGAHRYFKPGPSDPIFERAPEEFLDWLSGWVALTLRPDWKEEERRRMLAEIVPSYRQRGTPAGLKQALAAFTGAYSAAITILEQPEHPFQIGVSSTVGRASVLAGGKPHYFVVRALIPGSVDVGRKRAALRAIIDLEKPAHTFYDLFIQIPTLQVGKTSTVGTNTSLGIPIETPEN